MANAVPAFLDEHVAAGHGERPAIVTPARSYTYRDLLDMTNRMGNALGRLGVGADERVALVAVDSVAFVATLFGALRIGAVAVPLNPRLPPGDLAMLLRDSDAVVLVADPAVLTSLPAPLAGLPALRTVLAIGQAVGVPCLADMLAAAAPDLTPTPVADDAMAFWLYTSGTTDRPKAAVHLHRDLLAGDQYGQKVLRITAADRVFATSKLFFAYALGNGLLIPLSLGAQTYLLPDWPDPERVAAVLRGFRPTLFFSVPTFYARLLRAELPRDAFASMRVCVSAGERLPAEIYRAWTERFGVEILDGLGATETIFMVLSNRPGQSRPGSSGILVPGTEARLLDGEDRAVATGVPGILHVRTASASPMYWNRPEQSRRAFAAGWFRTGDVYYRDDAGFFYHCGRSDDLFKVAGQWVAPGDIEAVLLEHPDVLEAGAVGAVTDGGLVKPFAFVVPKSSAPDDLAAQLAVRATAGLQPHQRPREIFIVTELPRTTTGKLQRHRLRDRCAGRSMC